MFTTGGYGIAAESFDKVSFLYQIYTSSAGFSEVIIDNLKLLELFQMR